MALLRSCIVADSQHTNIWISAHRLYSQIWLLWLQHNGQTLCKSSWFKIMLLKSNKSQHLLDFNVHLPLSFTSHDSLLLLLDPVLPWALPYHWPTPPHMSTLLCTWNLCQDGTKMELVSRQQYVLNAILGCALADHFFIPDFWDPAECFRVGLGMTQSMTWQVMMLHAWLIFIHSYKINKFW